MKWFLLVGAGIGIAVVMAGIRMMKKMKNGAQSEKSETAVGDGNVEQCRLELKRYGGKFTDLYEPLRQVVEKTGHLVDKENLLFSWEARMEDDKRVLHLYQTWQSLQQGSEEERIIKWYKYLLELGARYSSEQTVMFDRTALKKYNFVDDYEAYLGKELTVESPYWYYEEIILDKGILAE